MHVLYINNLIQSSTKIVGLVLNHFLVFPSDPIYAGEAASLAIFIPLQRSYNLKFPKESITYAKPTLLINIFSI
jgi:hypothetical protein